MHLKRIDIVGFKSFAKKTTLTFEAPITTIVGPNGSGKSNVVEAIRFVLGEQSMKSLRGKGGSDLIFKGSKTLPKQNRAYVAMVFDNTKRIFSYTNENLRSSLLEYDEVTISREVFQDGSNVYAINGTQVRLKDITELVASVNIGTSSHHIISQGEADRLLSASLKDRRTMVEDALGLNVYQYRLKDSERKLDKTRENVKEINVMRRELAPHLAFLKKQVEKIEKAGELRQELETCYLEFFKKEETYIEQERAVVHEERAMITQALNEIDQTLAVLTETEEQVPVVQTQSARREELSAQIRSTQAKKDELVRSMGRIEALIEMETARLAAPVSVEKVKNTTVEFVAVRTSLEEIIGGIDRVLAGEHTIDSLKHELAQTRDTLRACIVRYTPMSDSVRTEVVEPDTTQLHEYETTLGSLKSSDMALEEEIRRLRGDLEAIEKNVRDAQMRTTEANKERLELSIKRNEILQKQTMVTIRHERLSEVISRFESEMRDAVELVGQPITAYVRFEIDQKSSHDREGQHALLRKIERLKIKLEESGIGGVGDIMKEFADTTERDQFLARELHDLENSIQSLAVLITELKETLDREFKQGVEKINIAFQKFFELMFGGGSAFLSIVLENKRTRKGDDDTVVADEQAELSFERGIDIHVSLPHKKTKDLHMLSGGERSLTSIALLFALSQVNPPPFLVLDETDAALDEANARRYGDMLERLSGSSNLVVVTHNRETMSRAGVIYGVTVGADGGSKLLSIKFEEAEKLAK
jgi:chromosome segregation protein